MEKTNLTLIDEFWVAASFYGHEDLSTRVEHIIEIPSGFIQLRCVEQFLISTMGNNGRFLYHLLQEQAKHERLTHEERMRLDPNNIVWYWNGLIPTNKIILEGLEERYPGTFTKKMVENAISRLTPHFILRKGEDRYLNPLFFFTENKSEFEYRVRWMLDEGILNARVLEEITGKDYGWVASKGEQAPIDLTHEYHEIFQDSETHDRVARKCAHCGEVILGDDTVALAHTLACKKRKEKLDALPSEYWEDDLELREDFYHRLGLDMNKHCVDNE